METINQGVIAAFIFSFFAVLERKHSLPALGHQFTRIAY